MIKYIKLNAKVDQYIRFQPDHKIEYHTRALCCATLVRESLLQCRNALLKLGYFHPFFVQYSCAQFLCYYSGIRNSSMYVHVYLGFKQLHCVSTLCIF
jgi:hypothetical protein